MDKGKTGQKTHAILLRDFFTALFEPEQTVYIYPGLSSENFERYRLNSNLLPLKLHNKPLKIMAEDWATMDNPWIPRQFIEPFTRKARSTNTKLIDQLTDFNNLGYDIFYCINPLTCATRCQKTVQEAVNILLEGDSDIEKQRQVFEKYKDYFSAIQFSGNKSLHAYARIDPSLQHYGCIGWKKARSLGKDTASSWDNYNELAQFWIQEMKEQGLQIDVQVAKDYSRLSRVPGFINSKSGKKSEVLFLNKYPNDTQSLIQRRTWDDSESSDSADSVSVIVDGSVESHGSIGSNISNSPDIVNFNLLPLGDISHSLSSFPNSESLPANLVKPTPSQSVYYTGMTNVKHIGGKRGGKWKEKTLKTFLDHLERYNELKTKGIAERGDRLSCHGMMFECQKVFEWDRDEMAREWEAIVSINPDNIGMSADRAVEDLMRQYDKEGASRDGEKIKDNSPYLPDSSSLPQDLSPRLDHLSTQLKVMGCERVKDVGSIITKVLWQKVRELPIQCQRGEVGLKSSEMCRACVRGQYIKPLEWMKEHHLVKVTDETYHDGKTRRYRVNIPLILYLLGFRSEELVWDKGSGAGKRGSIWKAA